MNLNERTGNWQNKILNCKQNHFPWTIFCLQIKTSHTIQVSQMLKYLCQCWNLSEIPPKFKEMPQWKYWSQAASWSCGRIFYVLVSASTQHSRESFSRFILCERWKRKCNFENLVYIDQLCIHETLNISYNGRIQFCLSWKTEKNVSSVYCNIWLHWILHSNAE